MTDRNKFEEMLERLVNEDREGAEELFHDIVVEKSREIYSSMLESDLEDEEEEVEETEEKDEEEEVEEGFDLDEFEVEADDDMMGGDPSDDMMGDIEMPSGDEEGDDMGGEDDVEDRVEDLEDALDELKAEFERMIKKAGDEGEEADDMGDDEESDDEESDDEEAEKEEFAFEADDEEVEEKTAKSASEQMREYVEKISTPVGEDNKATSPVASANDMGGNSVDPTVGGEEKGRTAPSVQEDDADNVNVPGGKASQSMSKQSAKSTGEDAGTNTQSAL